MLKVEIWQEYGMTALLAGYFRGNFAIIAKNFNRFIQNLSDDYFLQKHFQYVSLLGLGGSEKVGNLRIVKTREHIELISQMAGKIGM